MSELLDLKRENVHIDDHYFNVVASKTESGIRIVPIADKTYPFFRKWYEDGCEYLLHTPDGKHFDYRNYYDSYWTPVMELISCSHKSHDTRHTCISMLTEKEVSPHYDKEDSRTFGGYVADGEGLYSRKCAGAAEGYK